MARVNPLIYIPYGYCHCGCGRKTRIAQRHDPKRGYVRGRPYLCCAGHKPPKLPVWTSEDRGYETPCWIWQGHIRRSGYGSYYPGGGREVRAHRWMYEQEHGAVPGGLVLDHLCRVPACVNPDHLEPVTSTENVRRGAGVKLDWDKVAVIRSSPESGSELARRFGVSRAQAGRVRRNENWSVA